MKYVVLQLWLKPTKLIFFFFSNDSVYLKKKTGWKFICSLRGLKRKRLYLKVLYTVLHFVGSYHWPCICITISKNFIQIERVVFFFFKRGRRFKKNVSWKTCLFIYFYQKAFYIFFKPRQSKINQRFRYHKKNLFPQQCVCQFCPFF